MNSDDNGVPITEFDLKFDRAMAMLILVYAAILFLVGLVLWIIRARSLNDIARRRGIRNAWLAWVPVGCAWVLGSLADQYQHLVCGRVTSRRKTLVLSAFVMFVFYIASVTVVLMTIFAMIPERVLLFAGMPLILLGGTVGIVTLVFHHICNYDLYRSCNPKDATAFRVLGIILVFCEPFFYLACRKKDLGMVVPQAEMPAYTELPKVDPEF